MRKLSVVASVLFLLGFSPEPADISGWSFVPSKDSGAGIQTVRTPARSGSSAIKFTVQPGSCELDDCENDRERIELKQSGYENEGETAWYAWSFYLPPDFQSIWPARTFIGQFHQEGGMPAILFSIEPEGLKFETRFVNEEKALLVADENLRGRWHDIAMEVTWSRGDGHIRLYMDGELRIDRIQQTMSEDNVYFKFGIYRAHLSRAPVHPLPAQSVIFDRIRKGRTWAEVTR